jgi:hypothetical protein
MEIPMRDQKLETLISLAALLFVAHTADHVARDLRWPLTAEAIPFLLATLAILTAVSGALVLYRRGKLGPRFWAIFGVLSVTAGFLGHFSPFSEQPPQYILHAYRSAMVGWLAVGTLVALILTLIAITLYAGRLWLRGVKQ